MLLFSEEVAYAHHKNLIANKVPCSNDLEVFYSHMRNQGKFLTRGAMLEENIKR
jgi:hypothetical protein